MRCWVNRKTIPATTRDSIARNAINHGVYVQVSIDKGVPRVVTTELKAEQWMTVFRKLFAHVGISAETDGFMGRLRKHLESSETPTIT